MSDLLERRYRRLLRMLPKHYRASRGEELLGTLMEGADERRRWPEGREALGLVGLSLRTRFRPSGPTGADGGERGASLSGETARATAFLAAAVLALHGLDRLVLLTMARHSLFIGWPMPSRIGSSKWQVHYGVVATLHQELPALWLVVFALMAVGWWPAARVLALGEFVFAATTVHHTSDAAREQLALAAVATAALLVARGAHARRIRGRWLAVPGVFCATALAVAAIGLRDPLTLVNANPSRPGPELWELLWVGDWVLPDTEAALVMTIAAVTAAALLAWRSAAWPLAVTAVGFATLGSLVVERVDYVPGFTEMHRGGTQGAIEVIGVLFAIALLALVKERFARRSAAATSSP